MGEEDISKSLPRIFRMINKKLRDAGVSGLKFTASCS